MVSSLEGRLGSLHCAEATAAVSQTGSAAPATAAVADVDPVGEECSAAADDDAAAAAAGADDDARSVAGSVARSQLSRLSTGSRRPPMTEADVAERVKRDLQKKQQRGSAKVRRALTTLAVYPDSCARTDWPERAREVVAHIDRTRAFSVRARSS